MGNILKALTGWKTIIAYAAAHLFGAYPLVLGAFNKLIENPTNKAFIVEFIIQAALAFGVLDRLNRNLKVLNAKKKK